MTQTKFIHYRFYPNGFETQSVAAGGGASIAYKEIERNDNQPAAIIVGIAWCNPKDNFNRKMGRTIAEGRLTKYAEDIVYGRAPGYTYENTLLIDRGNKDQHVEERVREFFKDEMQDMYYF